ncbi:MAG: PqqD family protein [Anaerolineae bacterium]|nr:PqqD family protein [Anaerolineae bacterium]
MQASDKPKHSRYASYEMVDEEAIIINLKTGILYTLNDTAAVFWQLIDGQRTVTACAEVIAADYEDVEAGEVEGDLLELAAEFEAEGLIVT